MMLFCECRFLSPWTNVVIFGLPLPFALEENMVSSWFHYNRYKEPEAEKNTIEMCETVRFFYNDFYRHFDNHSLIVNTYWHILDFTIMPMDTLCCFVT